MIALLQFKEQVRTPRDYTRRRRSILQVTQGVFDGLWMQEFLPGFHLAAT